MGLVNEDVSVTCLRICRRDERYKSQVACECYGCTEVDVTMRRSIYIRMRDRGRFAAWEGCTDELANDSSRGYDLFPRTGLMKACQAKQVRVGRDGMERGQRRNPVCRELGNGQRHI